MIYKIRITDRAKNDMQDIHQYIANEFQNPTAAKRRISLIQAKIKSLKENPELFATVNDDFLAKSGIRLMVVKTQNVFFIINKNPNIVFIMRILHSRRDWINILSAQIDDLLDEIPPD